MSLGKLIPDDNPSGNLERGKLFLEKAAKVSRFNRQAGTEHNGCCNILAQAGVRHSKRGRLGHRGIAHQRVIDLERRNLFASPIDEIILTAVQREETVLIYAADVARPQPTVLQTSPNWLALAEIAGIRPGPLTKISPISPVGTDTPVFPRMTSSPAAIRPTVPGLRVAGGAGFAAITPASLIP